MSEIVTSLNFQVPYFDSGNPKGGDRAVLLLPEKPKKSEDSKTTSSKYAYLQRTLEESYFLGLDSRQLEQRSYNEILNRPKVQSKIEEYSHGLAVMAMEDRQRGHHVISKRKKIWFIASLRPHSISTSWHGIQCEKIT